MPQSGRPVEGASLGRYRLESVLGTGGMATVWKARDERLGRTVAVKVLSETLALDRDFVKRFRREAEVAAGLSHPNLVTVFDFSAEGPRPYLVSEYVEGGTLADRLAAGTRVDAEALARQLLEALAHIHGAGVVHRDIKPANVLIDRDGRSRLTDFGIAQPRDATQMTDAGKVLGTLAYMAPEVRAGARADERSDLYSAGILLEEVLPADGPTGLRSLAAALSAENPRARPASAQDALRMLDPGESKTVPVGAAGLPATERRPVVEPTAATRVLGEGPGRRRAGLALAALVLLAAGLALAQSLGGNDGGERGGDPGTPTSAPTQSSSQDAAPPSVQAAPADPAPVPAPPSAEQAAGASDSCQALEEQIQALAGKGGSEAPDKAAKDQLKEQENALREELKACGKNAGSSSEEGGD